MPSLQEVSFQGNHIFICSSGCYNQSISNWAKIFCFPIDHGDLTVLNKLYTATNGNLWSWNGNTPWNFTVAYQDTSVPCREWQDRIMCDSNTGRVIRLNLNSMNLDGIIPTELAALTYLSLLNLESNQLRSTIPTEFGKLVNINEIYLYNNHLTGAVPIELGNLTQLSVLGLDSNELTGIIPLSVCHMPSLQVVSFQRNHIIICSSGCYSQSISNWANPFCFPIDHGDLTVLNKLYTSTNGDAWSWSHDGSTPWNFTLAYEDTSIPCREWLAHINCDGNGRVTSLRLSYMNLDGFIPTEVGNLINLDIFDLNNNQLTGNLPTELGALSNINGIILLNNLLTGTVPTELGKLVNIRFLYLYNNHLTGAVPTELGNLIQLQYLGLSDNQLTGIIPLSVCHLSSLGNANFRGNNVIVCAPGCYSQSISNWANPFCFPIDHGDLTVLNKLYTATNGNLWSWNGNTPWNFTLAKEDTSIPCREWLDHINCDGDGRVTSLILNNMNLDGIIPTEVGTMINLNVLILVYNQLRSTIPTELGKLVNIKNIFLNNNHLTGVVPTELGNLIQLQYLGLNSNELTGIIPLSVCHLSSLGYANFLDNHIIICSSGCYSQSISNWAKSRCLIIDNGDLTVLNKLYTATKGGSWIWNGNTPWNFTAAHVDPTIPCRQWLDHINCDGDGRVTSLELNNMNLDGIIKTELGSLLNLNFLDLSFNHLSSTVPTELGKLINLQFLTMRNNGLTGIVPNELVALVPLYYLDLSHNLLSGVVPDASDFYCNSYSASSTNYGLQNTVNCNMIACGGSTLSISLCSSGNPCSGNTFLRLYDGFSQVASTPFGTCFSNTPCSTLTYSLPVGDTCRLVVLNQGCYGDGSCGGRAHVTNVAHNDYVYLDCYQDRSIPNNWGSIVFRNDRTMKWLGQSSSVEDCYNIAQVNGFHYFGVQFGSECYGAYNLTESHADTKCSTAGCVCDVSCPSGDVNCGGSYANSVYVINKKIATYDIKRQKSTYHLQLDTVNDRDSHALGWVKLFERLSGNIIFNFDQNVTNDLFHTYGTGNMRYIVTDRVFNYYKRLTKKSTFDLYSNVAAVWSSTDNLLHTDFEMYSSYSDLLSDSNQWQFCNYDDFSGVVGYPRDCGQYGSGFNGWSGFVANSHPNARPNAEIWIQIDNTPTSRPSVMPSRPTYVPSRPTKLPSVSPSKRPSSYKPSFAPVVTQSLNCLIEFIKNQLHSDETNHCKSLSGGGFTLNICAYKKSSKDDDVFYTKSSESGGMTVYDGHGAGSDRFLQLDMRSICNLNKQPSFAQLKMTSTNTKYSFQVIGSNTKGAIGSSSIVTSSSSSWNQYVNIPNYCKFNYLSIVSSARDSMLTGFQLNLCAPTSAPAKTPVAKPVDIPVSKPIVAPVSKPFVAPVSCDNEFISGRITSDDTVHSKSLSSGSYHMTAYAFKTSTGTNDMIYEHSEKSALALNNEEHASGNDKFIQFDITSICSGSQPLNAEIMMVSSTKNTQYNLVGSNKLGKLGSTMLPVSRWNQYVNIPDYCKYNYIGIISTAKDASIAGFRLRGCAPTRAPVQSIPKPVVAPVSKPVDEPIQKPVTAPETKPVSNPIQKPVAKPVSKPVSKPSSDHDGNNHASNGNNLTNINANTNGLSRGSHSNVDENSILFIVVILSLFSIAVILGAYWLYKRKSTNSVMKPSDTFTQDVVYDINTSVFESINPAAAVNSDLERPRRE